MRGGTGTNLSTILERLNEAPAREIPNLLRGFQSIAGLRKSSRVLGSHLYLDVLELNSPRLLVLTAALYFEHIVLVWAERNARRARPRPLAVELRAMLAAGDIDQVLHDNMRAVVLLRNRFAHDLFLRLADWDPTTAPFLAGATLPRRASLRAVKNLALLKILLIHIAFGLHDAFRWLYLEDVPPAYRKRASSVR